MSDELEPVSDAVATERFARFVACWPVWKYTDTINGYARQALSASPAQAPGREGVGKIASELEFIKGISTNVIRDIDEMEGAFSKSQRTRTTERKMADLRERAKVLFQCSVDALALLEPRP
jgi:hypothetical protein